MQAKVHYGYYILAPIHLTVAAIVVVGILVWALLWRWVGGIILAFGVWSFLSYWIGVLYFNPRQELHAFPEIAAGTLTCGGADIRPARPQDAPEAARLMVSTSQSMMLTLFGSTQREAVRALRWLFPLPGHTNSYIYAIVVEDRGDVVALLSGFGGNSYHAAERADWIYLPIWPLAIPAWQFPRVFVARTTYDEAIPPVQDGDFFIEYLAVSPEKRGQGIGSCLMDFAEGLASAKGLERMVLDVEVANDGARRFYRRAGFVEAEFATDKRYCEQFDFEGTIRLVKPIHSPVERHE